MKTYLISGATSYLAKCFIRRVIKDHKVIAMCRNKADMKEFEAFQNIQICEVEMRDYANIFSLIDENVDTAISFAWQGVYGEDLKSYEIQLNNVKYTCDLLDACSKHNVANFIFISSINELEIKTVVNTAMKLRATCNLGASKLAAEIMCKVIASNTNTQFMSALLPATFGEHNSLATLPNVLIDALCNDKPLKLVEGNFAYDFLYCEDVVDGLLAIDAKGHNLNRYFIGHQKLKLMKDLIVEIRDILNPKYELEFGDYLDSNMIDFNEIDINKLYEHTGFKINSDFKEQIRKTANWRTDKL